MTGMVFWKGSDGISMLYPGGKNALNPSISSGCAGNNVDTRWITPGVSMLMVFGYYTPSRKLGNNGLTFDA